MAALENNEGAGSADGDQQKWFCHTCNSQIIPDLSEFKCPICGNGFIEAIEEEISDNETRTDSPEDAGNESFAATNQPQTIRQPVQPENFTYSDSPLSSFSFPPPFGTRNAAQFIPPAAFDGFYGFAEQLLFGLMGGLNPGPATFSIQMGPHMLNGNSGDYVFTGEGLDNIVTMLMNQLEGAGPPPAAKEHVDALPVITITQAQVDDKLQCHICMENFQPDERAKELPCRHVYHGDCIVPWLQLHGTCPVCRKRIDANTRNPNSNNTYNSGEART